MHLGRLFSILKIFLITVVSIERVVTVIRVIVEVAVVRVVVVISVVAISRITVVPSVITIAHTVVSVVSLVPVVVLGFSLTFSDSMNNTGRVSVISIGFGSILVNNWSIAVNTGLINMVKGIDSIGQFRGFLSLLENLDIVSEGTSSRVVEVIGNRLAFFTKNVFFGLVVVVFIFTLFLMSFAMLGFGKLDTIGVFGNNSSTGIFDES